jgi:hypothetical protein
MPAPSHAGQRSEPVKATKPITPEEAARITWDKLPTVKAEPVVLEPKPLFVLTGGNRAT